MRNWRAVGAMIIALCTCITCSSSGKKESMESYVTIRGKVNYPQTGQIVIQELKDASTGWQDTIQLKKDKTFTKRILVKEPGYYRINFYNQQVVNIILFKNDLEINVDGNNMNGVADVKGSPELDFIIKANQLSKDVETSPEVAKLNQEYQDAGVRGDQAKMAELTNTYQKLVAKNQEQIVTMIKQQPVSLGVINFLQNDGLDKDQFFDLYILVADKLKKEWPNYAHAKSFIALVDGMRSTSVGQVAPEIALPDPSGKVVKLSSLRGKYVLVDFWAKWCGPCRHENPTVVAAYKKYKDKGFDIFGVSLDRNKEDWVRAIQEDGLTWTQVSDLKYWQSEAARLYNVNSIPFSLLLDPEGKIIAKNLRGPALDAKLEEVLIQKTTGK